ncbi:hypothetical protein [Oryzobacter telluris]|uniref:hypothetical protein n=1 Tax=Oryzobacter telluris TaxID=3149179 RepID=UPI00370D9CE2
MGYEVQLEALEHDAKIWDRTSDVLDDAAGEARSITVTTISTSVIADATGFNSAYADLQDFVAGILDGGATATDTMAATLRDVKRQYEADDDAALRRIGAEWSPVE